MLAWARFLSGGRDKDIIPTLSFTHSTDKQLKECLNPKPLWRTHSTLLTSTFVCEASVFFPSLINSRSWSKVANGGGIL